MPIKILEPHIANQIAAGEVVERPVSVVKELLENAIDAQAKHITIKIKNGGVDTISIADDGIGIPAEEALTAFERHATSKISTEDDLTHIETLGFRGEALSSIAAVSQVELQTAVAEAETGVLLRIEGGECKARQPVAMRPGTTIVVENLFYNVPARRKFLKSTRTEAANIGDVIANMILARPDITFEFVNNEKTVYKSAGDGQLKNALYCVYGEEVLPHIREVDFDNGFIRISGFIGTAEIARPNKRSQHFFLNRRCIRSFMLSNTLQRAYDVRLMSGRYPFCVLHLAISSREVDVNVHPAKLEVRFAQEGRVQTALSDACKRALGHVGIPSVELPLSAQRQAVSFAQSTYQNSQNAKQLQENSGMFSLNSGKPASSPKNYMMPAPVADRKPAGNFKVKESVYDIPLYHIAHMPAEIANKPYDGGAVKAGRDAYAESQKYQQKIDSPLEKAPEGQSIEQPHEMPPAETLKELAGEQSSFGDAPISIIGQAYHTFWIVQQGEQLFFVDQHAAHERRLYERFMSAEEQVASQLLLIPELLQLTPSEFAEFAECDNMLAQMGFGIEASSHLTVRVHSVPSVLAGAPVGRILREGIETILRLGSNKTATLRKEAIIQASCKHAIKGGDPITEDEIKELLAYFIQDGIPLTCPHGRPVLFRLTKKELEKMFKRIV